MGRSTRYAACRWHLWRLFYPSSQRLKNRLLIMERCLYILWERRHNHEKMFRHDEYSVDGFFSSIRDVRFSDLHRMVRKRPMCANNMWHMPKIYVYQLVSKWAMFYRDMPTDMWSTAMQWMASKRPMHACELLILFILGCFACIVLNHSLPVPHQIGLFNDN